MQNLTTRTTIRIEFAGMGKKPDGIWRKITASQNKEEEAQKLLDEYIADVSRYPDVYTNYGEYKVMKRTVITTCEEWGDVE